VARSAGVLPRRCLRGPGPGASPSFDAAGAAGCFSGFNHKFFVFSTGLFGSYFIVYEIFI
jgi:hypothetical protein